MLNNLLLRPGSSEKGLRRVCGNFQVEVPMGTKIYLSKRRHTTDKYVQTKTKYRKEKPIKEKKMFNLVLFMYIKLYICLFLNNIRS